MVVLYNAAHHPHPSLHPLFRGLCGVKAARRSHRMATRLHTPMHINNWQDIYVSWPKYCERIARTFIQISFSPSHTLRSGLFLLFLSFFVSGVNIRMLPGPGFWSLFLVLGPEAHHRETMPVPVLCPSLSCKQWKGLQYSTTSAAICNKQLSFRAAQ